MEDIIRDNIISMGVLIASVPPLVGIVIWLGIRQVQIMRRYRNILDVDRETAERQSELRELTATYMEKRTTYDELRQAIRVFEETLEATPPRGQMRSARRLGRAMRSKWC